MTTRQAVFALVVFAAATWGCARAVEAWLWKGTRR